MRKQKPDLDTTPCLVCGAQAPRVERRAIAFAGPHQNAGGEWCSGGLLPDKVLQTTECPGELPIKNRRGRVIGHRSCGELITIGTRRCKKCGTNIAYGSLTTFRMAAHAKGGIKRSWVKKFLRG